MMCPVSSVWQHRPVISMVTMWERSESWLGEALLRDGNIRQELLVLIERRGVAIEQGGERQLVLCLWTRTSFECV